MRQISAVLLLSLLGLLLVYGAVAAAEAVSTTKLVLFLGNDIGVPGVWLRIGVLLAIAFPIAYLTGYGLVRWMPELRRYTIPLVALLYTLAIGMLQFYVYDVSVLGATMLKLAFVLVPLVAGAYRLRPQSVA